MPRRVSPCLFLRFSILLFVPSRSDSLESCLGPGFTKTVPPEEELSQYSATVLQPGDRAIYTTLSFRCNGRLESLTIPSQVRGSDYPLVDNYLEPRPSIWRCNGTGCYFFFESGKRQQTTRGFFIRLQSEDVLSYNFIVEVQMDIQAGDVLGFWLLSRGEDSRLEHLPLLYKPGRTPGTFTPIIIANFISINPSTTTPRMSSSSSSEDIIVTQTSTGPLSSSNVVLVVTPTSTSCLSDAQALTSIFDSSFVTAGITAAAVQLEVLFAILVTAYIVCRCRGRESKNNRGFEETSTLSTIRTGPLTTQNNLPAEPSGRTAHEYETLRFQAKYPNTYNGGNAQNVDEDTPLEEYYHTSKYPKTESSAYSYI